MSSSTPTRPTPERRIPRALAWLYVVGGLIGLVAAAALLIERIELLKNPDYIPTCSFNPVMACGSVMTSWQGELLGFPNPILGVAAFAVVVTIGAGLLAGARFARWFWLSLLAGTVLGFVFVTWLAHQSLYAINYLCPYCMVVWAVTVPIFVFTAAHVLAGRDQDPDAAPETGIGGFFLTFRWVILLFWFGLVLALILVRFWSYWSTLL